jgi:hypothetical protein
MKIFIIVAVLIGITIYMNYACHKLTDKNIY